MQEHFPPPLSEIAIGALCTAFAIVCGWIKYLTEVQEGKIFSWSEFILKGGVSAVFGMMCFGLSSLYELPGGVVGAICGMSGWLGTSIVVVVKAVAFKHLHLTKDDVENVK